MNHITITKEGSRWTARFRYDFETKEVVKRAGWFFSPTEKLWYTRDPVVAAKLDPNAVVEAKRMVAQVNATLAASRATTADVKVPAPEGMAYLPYQLAGIKFALDHQDVLIGDEMGLGKTITAIGLINADRSIKRVLVVCPASLKINWAREMNKWLTRGFKIETVEGSEWPWIKQGQAAIRIVNYDILARHRAKIDAVQWDLVIADEVHYAKNPETKRTQALFGVKGKGGIVARKRVFMSGTPICNRPKEMWGLVQALDPMGLGRSWFKFAMRYCDAKHNGYGWDFSGASNLAEFQTYLRTKFMIRRLKADVLKDLPPKRHQIVVIPNAIKGKNAEREAALMARAEMAGMAAKARGEDEYAAVMRVLGGKSAGFEEMSELRHATAVAKIPHVVAHVTEMLEEVEKVVVFVHHHDVAHALRDAFPGAAVVTGETSVSTRMAQVDAFQNDPKCRVFVGSIIAAGAGLTLTAAQHVVFAELDWVPGNVKQAEDRLHRIGQAGSVLVQHLVFANSVDSYMANVIVAKQATIEAGLDNEVAPVALPETIKLPQAPQPAPTKTWSAVEARSVNRYLDRASGDEIDVPVDAECPF